MFDLWALATIICKAALYLSALKGCGLALTRLAFSDLIPTPDLSFFAVTAGISAIFMFVLSAIALTGTLLEALSLDIIGLLWSTSASTVLVSQIIGAALLFCGGWLAGLGSVILLGSFTLTGHAADLDQRIMQVVLFVHLGCIAFWIGILRPLNNLSSSPKAAATLGARFGVLAMCFVPVLTAAGGYLAYQMTGSWTAVFGTSYGQIMIMKTLGLACLLFLGAYNKLRLIPNLQSGGDDRMRRFTRVLRLEYYVFIAIISVTAILTTNLSPPYG